MAKVKAGKPPKRCKEHAGAWHLRGATVTITGGPEAGAQRPAMQIEKICVKCGHPMLTALIEDTT